MAHGDSLDPLKTVLEDSEQSLHSKILWESETEAKIFAGNVYRTKDGGMNWEIDMNDSGVELRWKEEGEVGVDSHGNVWVAVDETKIG